MTDKIDLTELDDYDDEGFLRPEKLALVHVTDYMPQKKRGHWEIQSTAEATDYFFPRNTIHFTVGHLVSSHLWGNWDGKGIMIVTPMKGVIDKNDKPLGMSSFDTYFETTPGHNLELPKGTHIFVPTDDLKKLNGQMNVTEGDITYYKTKGFTQEEKRHILQKTGGISYNGKKITNEKEFGKLPEGLLALSYKKILLDNFMEKEGYISGRGHYFQLEAEKGAQEVADLGEKLGCRFCSAGNKGHSTGNFEKEDIVVDCFHLLRCLDFIFHSDDYKIIHQKEYGPYVFSKNGKTEDFKMSSDEQRFFLYESDVMYALSDLEQIDYFKERIEKAGKIAETGDFHTPWSDAFKATYAVWAKKTIQRLEQYKKMSKGFDLDAWQEKMIQRMEAYGQGGLLSRAFANPAETPEREKKATKLLKILRERDDSGSKKTLRTFLEEKNKKAPAKKQDTHE